MTILNGANVATGDIIHLMNASNALLRQCETTRATLARTGTGSVADALKAQIGEHQRLILDLGHVALSIAAASRAQLIHVLAADGDLRESTPEAMTIKRAFERTLGGLDVAAGALREAVEQVARQVQVLYRPVQPVPGNTVAIVAVQTLLDRIKHSTSPDGPRPAT